MWNAFFELYSTTFHVLGQKENIQNEFHLNTMRRKTTARWGSLVSIRCLFWSSDSWKYESIGKNSHQFVIEYSDFSTVIVHFDGGLAKVDGQRRNSNQRTAWKPFSSSAILDMQSPETSPTDIKKCWPSDSHDISWWSQVRKLLQQINAMTSVRKNVQFPFAHRPGYLPPKILHTLLFFISPGYCSLPKRNWEQRKFWG